MLDAKLGGPRCGREDCVEVIPDAVAGDWQNG